MVIGLGLAALGRPAYITLGRDADLGNGSDRGVDVMRDRTEAVLDAAWAAGVRFVDVARSYGVAESFLGGWIAAHPERRAELTVQSKWGYRYLADWRMDAEVNEVKDHSLEAFDAQWPETRAALGSAPDDYLVHSLTADSPALGDAALLDRLRALAESGVRVGLSTSGPTQGAVLDAARELPASPFSAVEATWNLLEPSAGPALARASDAGWLVTVKETLANGRLGPRGTDGAVLAARTGRPADAVALGAVLAQPWANVVLSGAVTPQQLASNLAAQPLDAADLDALGDLAEPAEQYWVGRAHLAWS